MKKPKNMKERKRNCRMLRKMKKSILTWMMRKKRVVSLTMSQSRKEEDHPGMKEKETSNQKTNSRDSIDSVLEDLR